MSQPTVVVTEEGLHFIVKIGKDTKGPFLKFPEVHIVPVSDGAFTVDILGIDLQGDKVEIRDETHFVVVSRKRSSDQLRKSPSEQPSSSRTVNARPSRPPPAASSG